MTTLRVRPGRPVGGGARVLGDKSIAHRWLILAATARGRSRIAEVPPSLDVRSTARSLAFVTPSSRGALEGWAGNDAGQAEGHGSTWNAPGGGSLGSTLEVEGEGLDGLLAPGAPIDCGNSGTTMRLLAGVLAGRPGPILLVGDESLSTRPMERVAEPLRAMGAGVVTTQGHAPMTIDGGRLRGIRYRVPVASAQVKGAILFAALSADGETAVEEPVATRDHTERALAALGGPVQIGDGAIVMRGFAHGGFDASVPGDVSSAAFLLAAAALTDAALTIEGVGLNPSRLRFLDVMGRMGVSVQRRETAEVLGEPVGTLSIAAGAELAGTTIDADELPLVVDEVPILALLAVHARGETSFLGADELRVKESDRLHAIAEGIRGLGGHAGEEGSDLVLPGGGLTGGHASSAGDHRMAMALAVGALRADGPCEIHGVEAADVSFPGFARTLRDLGADFAEVGV